MGYGISQEFRLKCLDNAKKILKSETISPEFFAELVLALPESSSIIMRFDRAKGVNFDYAIKLLSQVAGVVLTKTYGDVPDPNNSDKSNNFEYDYPEAWDWYHKVAEAGNKYIEDVNIKGQQLVGMITFEK